MNNPTSLTRYAKYSIAAALVTICLKGTAYALTGSVGLLSDALESLVNLAGAVIALLMLSWAESPPDEDHAYGHDKAEYFSSGAEGMLILLAAGGIAWDAVQHLLKPHSLAQPLWGVILSGAASVVNFLVAQVLLRAGREHHSITLEADGKHLLTDVWTSCGIMLGITLVTLTGWERLDPLVALCVVANIVWQGSSLVKRSVLGLMDTALPESEFASVRSVLEKYGAQGIQFHALRTRQAGARRFVAFHVLVPGEWTVARGHDLLELIEGEIREAVPNATVFTHLEPREDPNSFQDIRLDRPAPP